MDYIFTALTIVAGLTLVRCGWRYLVLQALQPATALEEWRALRRHSGYNS